jgi:hypothetical protein
VSTDSTALVPGKLVVVGYDNLAMRDAK